MAAVRKVSLELQAGQFYVLRGENGAGKSTLLRMIAGLNEPTEGLILIFGAPNRQALHQMGYMAHAPLLYDELDGMENLRFFAQLYGISSDQPLVEAMQRVGLDPALTRRVGSMWSVYFTLLFMLTWMGLATFGPLRSVDPYPFPFLLFMGNVVQLLLVFVILVGQQVLGRASDKRAMQTYDDSLAIFHKVTVLHE